MPELIDPGEKDRQYLVIGTDMDDWFSEIASNYEFPGNALHELRDIGFVVIPGLVLQERLARLGHAYDSAVSSPAPDDKSIGRTTTRVQNLVNCGPDFDQLYLCEPILAACCITIGGPFRLSAMLARSVNPNAPEQVMHVDFQRDEQGWPMIGFIIMLDDFRSDNGSTRFVPGSHTWSTVPGDPEEEPSGEPESYLLACGRAGSVIVYNGSIWHGHSANQTNIPRRSIQGAYIRRDATSGFDMAARMRPDTLARISPLAKYLLAV